ncbi:MAG: FAD-dependent oxidoreductase [Alphaproteobacteria bacterium]
MPLLTTNTFLPEKADLPAPIKGKTACIGSGPASLACAAALRLKGYDVTIFEALPKAGGSLTYCIPEYKLAQRIVDEQIKRLEDAGIKIVLNSPFCTGFNAKKLEKMGFQAVFLGLGLWEDKRINIGGADLNGVFNASGFLALTKFNALPLSTEDAVVIAGSDRAAVCCAAVSALNGAGNVFLIAKDRFDECAADPADIAFAQSLGISVLYGFEAKKIIGKDGQAAKFRARMPDGSGEIELNATKVVCSFGRVFSKPNAGCSLMLSKNKLIETRNFATLKAGYFSGGSAVRGEKTTISQSVDDGKKAAEQIDFYLKNK